MLENLAPTTAALIIYIAVGLIVAIIWMVIWWAVIRAAVLSALRKHADEQRATTRERRLDG